MSQGWSPPPPVLLPPSRALALLSAAGSLCVLAPFLATVSLFAVFFSMDQFLALEDACETYACGEGVGFTLILFAVGWMCAIWVIGLIAAVVDWAWVVWSV